MCGGDDHLAWKHPVSLEACRGLRTTGGSIFLVPSLDSPSWTRVRGRLTRVSDQPDQRVDQRDMDSQVVTVDQFAAVMASIQEAIAGLGQRIDGQQAPPQDGAQYDSTAPPPPPLSQSVPHPTPYVLHSQTDATPLPVVAPIQASEDAHARMDRLEQRIRQMRVSDGDISWDDFDGAPVVSLPTQFRMPEIERYTGIGCPKIHLRLYSSVMRAHGLDEAHLIMLFPISLSGAAQRWFASLDASRRRTWDDLAQEFLRQFAFNTVIDVSRRELEALRQGPDESVTSFISRWREKIAQIVDRPSEKDQISMILRSLQPRFARHLMGFPHTDFGSLVQALYGIEEGIARRLWPESSPYDSKGKKPLGGQRPGDVSAISSVGSRSPRRYQTFGQTSRAYYPQRYAQYRPPRPMIPTYLHQTPEPVFAAQVSERPPTLYPRPRAPQTTIPFVQRPTRQFSQLGMPLSRAFQKLMEGGLLTQLEPRPVPQPVPPRFKMDLHCSYHQGPGHDTDHCAALRHAIQDLIDQGLVNLGQPSVTANPLPAHSTHAVPPPPGAHQGPPAPFILRLDDDDLEGRDVQIVTRSGRIAQPPPLVSRPFDGAVSHEEVRREDDEILRQLQSTQAHISIWSLLASSSTHRDALIRALSQIRVETTTTPEGLIHMMTADRATCIVFSYDDLPPEGSDYTHPLYITVGCSGHRVPSVLLDNGSALNVCPLATAIALGYAPSDFGTSTQTVRAYDSTKREVMGTLMIELMIGPTTFPILFQVLRIPTSFNLLLGRPWIHRAGAIPSSLHQKVKFIHDGQVIIVRSTGIYLPLLSQYFRSVTHSSTVVLDMMRGMTFLPGMGLGRRQQGPREFIAAIDHDTTFGLGFIPTEADYRQWRDCTRRGGSETRPRLEEIDSVVHTDRETDLQHLFHQLQLSDGAPDSPFPLTITPTSPDRASMLSLCFPEEITGDGVMVDSTEMIDGVVSHDEYRDEMDMMTMSQITSITLPVPELPEDDSSLFEGIVSPVEGASDLVDPSLSFDVLSGFVSRSDDVSVASFMDLSIFEYSPASCDSTSISAPHSPTSQIFDINDEVAWPDSDRDSSDHDSDPVDERVSPDTGDVETDMPGLDPSIVQHHLPILPHVRPIKQKLRRLHPRWSLQVKEEIQKQLSVGFISVVEYPSGWLMSSQFPKRMASTAGHSMLSFMDGFSGYNQILMAPEDMEKTAFITEWGTYCYKVMPFGLKNAGTTYQRAATTLFHDMMHKDVEVYVDDMIVKSRGRADYLAALERFFERIRKFRLRLNPKKCTFGVTSGKLLGHMVSDRGIEVDPDKIKAILDMPVPRTEKEIRGFLSRLQYISRFIARLTDICEPIFRLLRKNL
ncbi:Retrovirus-related Pol polyprotein from transposon 17.6 [Vitis vinifera]|uniref:Retrovirus-related Pol polyprotein from transposon 17.6 n=1 Tax=Vitis vinifera TaxID=29760 RepID=A0A438CG28_VITVI|nr:Retrovirus-related Pol polyprotein from transposon 17.6 [Vitis vinifera]